MDAVAKEVQVIKATKTGEKSEKIRVAAYCRVSTDKDDQLNSFFAQMRYYRDYVRGNDKMELVDIYADEGITGTELEKRDEMKRLIRDCKHKKIDRVLVKSVTRFARNSLECIETIRTMQSCGVSVLFENDRIDTEKMNSEMMLFIKSAFAQSEATSASKRMSTSIRMKMEDGTYIATSAPFGYKLVNGEYIVVPEEAEVIRKIFALYLQGYGTNAIAKMIRDTDGDKREWNRQAIRYILTNEKYIGDTMYQKSFTPAVLPLRNRANRGELPKYYCEGTQEAIVAKEDFIAVKNLMREREGKHYKQYTPTQSGNYFLLYGSETVSGATVNKRVKIVVDDASGNEINYSFNDAVADTAKVNDVILLPDGTASGGSGRLTVVSAILNSDEKPVELLYENDTNIFIPKAAGTYTLETTVTDFLGRSEAFRKTITVNENPDIIDVNYVPLAVKAGAAFNIPSYVCSDESKTVKVYIDGNEYTDSKYTPTKDFELKYVAGSYEESYNVKAINIASEKGFMKNYFLCDGGEATFNDDSELLLRANADGAKYTFLQKISSRYLEIGLKLNKDKADYSALNFYIQDAERVDVQIKASLVFENDKFYLVYDGAKKASLASDYYSNVGVIKYSYEKNAFVENDGTIVAEPSQILNGRLFNGFGDYVYLTIEYEGVTGDCEMIMSSIANQMISDKKTDTVKPEVYFDSIQAFTTRLGVGDSIILSKVYAYDVLQDEMTTSVEIFLLKGDDKESVYRVTDENGYAYTFNQAGTYEIVYSAQDSVGNGVESRKTIYCVDTTPPTITLKKYSKSASLGKNYKLPTYNVSDNDSDVTTYIIVCYDTGYEELMSDGYRFKTAGTHKIRVLAIDAAGNSSAAEYTVEVK